jgi:hypothetical protein
MLIKKFKYIPVQEKIRNVGQQSMGLPCIFSNVISELAKRDITQVPARYCKKLMGRVGIEPT